MTPKSGFVPRKYHDMQVEALTIRVIAAEAAIDALLNFIDPDLLPRHGQDYLPAVQELLRG